MATTKLYMWFVWVAGDVTAAAQKAGFKAEFDPLDGDTTIVVFAHLAESAMNIAANFGTVIVCCQIREATEAEREGENNGNA